MTKLERGFLAAILLLSLSVRFWGLQWGLSDRHVHSYHPDEITLVDSAARVHLLSGEWNPHFYNYGTLQIYLLSFLDEIADKVFAPMGLIPMESFPKLVTLYFWGRLLTVVLGTATVGLVFLLGRALFCSVSVGLFAALLLALTPISVVHSHYVTVDIPLAFWVTLCVLLTVSAVQKGQLWRLFLAGMAAGFAAATKYNGGVILTCPLMGAILLWCQSTNPPLSLAKGLKYLMSCVGGSILAFLLGCPAVLFASDEFQRSFLFEIWHARTGFEGTFAGMPPAVIYHLTDSLCYGIGLPLLLLSVVGLVHAIRTRSSSDWVLLAAIIPFYLLLGSSKTMYMRYVLPLVPFLAILAARIAIEGWKTCQTMKKPRTRCFLALAMGSIVAGHLLLGCCAYDRLFSQPDTRDVSGDYIRKNLPQKSSIGLVSLPWFHTPDIEYWNGGEKTRRSFQLYQQLHHSYYQFEIIPWDSKRLRSSPPDCFVMNEFEYRDRLRLRQVAAKDFFQTLQDIYGKPRIFRQRPQFLGLSFGQGFVPHDWLYLYPTERVYMKQRKTTHS